MSNSRWGAIFALGLITGGLFAVVALVWLVGLNYCPGSPCENYSSPNNNPPYHEYWIPFAVGPDTTSDVHSSDSEEHEDYYTRQDLRAQETVARATNAIVYLSAITIIVGSIGTAAVIWTLIETRRNIDVSKEIGEAQVRAYLTVDRAAVRLEISQGHVAWLVDASFRNSGSSPASGINAMMTYVIGQHTSTRIIVRDLPAGMSETRELRASQRPDSIRFHLDSDTKVVFRVAIEVEYRDVFNKQREGVFEFFGVFDLIDGESYDLAPVGRTTA